MLYKIKQATVFLRHGVDERKNFTRSTTPLPWPILFVTGMLTRDSFAVANLLVLWFIVLPVTVRQIDFVLCVFR